MNDPYPQTIKIEIDRDRLCRYLRLQCFFGWTTTLVLFGPLFGVLLLVGEKNRNRFDSVDEFYQQMFRGLSWEQPLDYSLVLFVTWLSAIVVPRGPPMRSR